jgi:hypothetical protein
LSIAACCSGLCFGFILVTYLLACCALN